MSRQAKPLLGAHRDGIDEEASLKERDPVGIAHPILYILS